MKRVLLIEDDTVLRENTAELLGLFNFDVKTAENGRLGIEIAKSELPDIIVCDIMMPEVDGYGVLDALSRHGKTKYIPFIFLSAKTEHKDVRRGMDLGADDYITKPFEEDELLSAIESRLAKTAILKEAREINQNNDVELGEIRSLNELKNYFVENGTLLNITKGHFIYEEGQNSNYIYLMRKGVVKCNKLDEKGKELTTALYKEHDLFGYTSFTQNIPYQETATSIEDTELLALSKNQLNAILDSNHKVTLELMQLLTEDISGIKDQLLQMAYSSVNKKTATTLLKFAEKLNRKPGDPIKISRNDLASVAGIATETLIRTMSDFKKRGIIDIDGRNIMIMDLEKLQEIN